jgi:hypothetical protein
VWFKQLQLPRSSLVTVRGASRQQSRKPSHFLIEEERRDAKGSSEIRNTESQLQSTETVHNETNHGHDCDEGINGAFVEMTKDCFCGCRLIVVVGVGWRTF